MASFSYICIYGYLKRLGAVYTMACPTQLDTDVHLAQAHRPAADLYFFSEAENLAFR